MFTLTNPSDSKEKSRPVIIERLLSVLCFYTRDADNITSGYCGVFYAGRGGGRFGCYCKRAAPIVIEHLLALLLERTLATSLQTKRKSSISDELKRDSNIQCELKKKN